MIKETIKTAAKRGFALGIEKILGIMSRVAEDGRQGFRTISGFPSLDTIRR